MKKTIGILICMLFIGTSFLPIISGDIDNNKIVSNDGIVNVISSSDPDQLDQFQIIDEMGYNNVNRYQAQSFKPTLDTLTRVSVRTIIDNDSSGHNSSDFFISIRDNLYGSDLTGYLIDSSIVGRGLDWYDCDFPDISIIPEKTYYIVMHDMGNGFFTVGCQGTYGSGDVYKRGTQWQLESGSTWGDNSNYDFCFKTYGYGEGDSGPEFEVGLYPSIGFGLSNDGLSISVKNIGDSTAHNVTLINLSIDGIVLYNNRVTEWERDIEPGTALIDSPNSMFIGFGRFTATMTVTCDEGITGSGSGNGFIFGPFIFVP